MALMLLHLVRQTSLRGVPWGEGALPTQAGMLSGRWLARRGGRARRRRL